MAERGHRTWAAQAPPGIVLTASRPSLKVSFWSPSERGIDRSRRPAVVSLEHMGIDRARNSLSLRLQTNVSHCGPSYEHSHLNYCHQIERIICMTQQSICFHAYFRDKSIIL